MNKTTIDNVLKYSIIGGLFVIPFIPLYVSNNLFFPFITGKAFAFRILVEIIFALWLVLLLRDKKYAPKISKLSLAITLFTVAVLVADLAGMNPLRSIWSNSERMEGWVTIVHLWAYFIVVTSVFGTGIEGRRNWHNLFNVTLVAAFVVGMCGFGQIIGSSDWIHAHMPNVSAFFAKNFPIHQGSSRIDASLGNSIYMAVYMLIHSFMAIYMSFVERQKRRIGISWVYMVLAVIFSYLLFETATRGTILAFIGGIALALGIYAVFGKSQTKKSRLISGGVIVAMILIAVLFYLNKNASFIQKNETLQRMASISISDTTTQARGYIWPMAVKGAFESPKSAIIGSGQENFNYIFNANYNPKMWSQEQWFDRVHNVYLDWLVAGGLVTLLLYVSLFVLAIVGLWKSDLKFVEKCVLTGLVAGYAVHNIFVFDNLISYILFFTILGFVHSLGGGRSIKLLERKDDQSENSVIVRDYIFVPVIALLFLATLYFVDIRPVQANTRLIAAMTACSNGGNPSAALFIKSLDLNQYMLNQEIREQLINCATNVIQSNLSEIGKTDFYNLAKKEINDQVALTPKDARAYILGGGFFNNIGDWKSALPLLEKAHELSPAKQTIDFVLATTYLNSGKEKEALVLLEKAYMDAPDNDTSVVAYATALILNGQEKKARETFADKPEIFTDQRIIGVYARLKQYPKVIEIFKALIAKDPENMQNYGSLASAYLANGDKALAIAELREAEKKFPLLKEQAEALIKDIQAGKNVLQ